MSHNSIFATQNTYNTSTLQAYRMPAVGDPIAISEARSFSLKNNVSAKIKEYIIWDENSNSFTDSNSGKRYERRGNYYQWRTATAASDRYDVDAVDVPDSICPHNWRLPSSNRDIAIKGYYKLLKIYQVKVSDTTNYELFNFPLNIPPADEITTTERLQSDDRDYPSNTKQLYKTSTTRYPFSPNNVQHNLYINNSGAISPSDIVFLSWGYASEAMPMRCVAR